MLHTNEFVVLTSGGPIAWIVINALRRRFGEMPIIMEDRESTRAYWRDGGVFRTASQRSALALAELSRGRAQKRIERLIEDYELDDEPDPDARIVKIRSINMERCRDLLWSIGPKAVFAISTQKIEKATLDCLGVPFIGYHPGALSDFRGPKAGYFALAEGAPERFGPSIHLIEEGYLTGPVLYQATAPVSKRDNLHTFEWLLAAGARDLACRAIQDAIDGQLRPIDVPETPRPSFAPTLFQYLWFGARRGVW